MHQNYISAFVGYITTLTKYKDIKGSKMENSFKEKYDKIEKSKKLNFLKQLLLKDSDLQEQFIMFFNEKKPI